MSGPSGLASGGVWRAGRGGGVVGWWKMGDERGSMVGWGGKRFMST